MTCIALMLLYGSRYVLSACLPHLIYIQLEKYNHSEGEVCPDAIHYLEPTPNVHSVYLEWSKGEQYYIFSSFFLGYILAHMPSGMFCDIYGAKHFLSLGVLGSGIISVAMPTVLTETPWYYTAGLQAILGLLQGMCMPAIMSLMQHWIPIEQQTLLTSYGYSGGCLGNMLSSIMMSYFMTTGHWQIVFYIWSGLIFIWFFIALVFVYSRPHVHPHMSRKEELLLEEQFGTSMPRKIPWKDLISDSALWAIFAGQLGHNYLIYTVDANIPEFFKRVIGFDLEKDVFIFSIPYMCQWLSIVASGYLGDYLITNNYVPVVYLRGTFAVIGNVLSSVFVLLTTYMECNKILILVCFASAMIAKGCSFAGLKCNILDISRHYSGVVQAIDNGLPAFTGMATSQIIGYICKRQTLHEWRKVFWFALAVCSFTTIPFAIWSKGERASWDIITKENKRDSYKRRH